MDDLCDDLSLPTPTPRKAGTTAMCSAFWMSFATPIRGLGRKEEEGGRTSPAPSPNLLRSVRSRTNCWAAKERDTPRTCPIERKRKEAEMAIGMRLAVIEKGGGGEEGESGAGWGQRRGRERKEDEERE
jgi:hypothetical protein